MKRLRFFLDNFAEIVSGASLVITILAVAFNVSMRYFFSRSQNWAEEIAGMGFAWTIFVGSAVVYKHKMHIGIDVFVNLLPLKCKQTVTNATNGFLIVLNLYLTYLSFVFAVSAWNKPTAVLYIPYTFVDVSATIGFLLMTYHSIRFFREDRKSDRLPATEGA